MEKSSLTHRSIQLWTPQSKQKDLSLYSVFHAPGKTGKLKNIFPGLEKSWKKEKLKYPGKILEIFSIIHMKLEFSIFIEDHTILLKHFLPQTIVLENLNFDLEKSWKNAYEKVWELWYCSKPKALCRYAQCTFGGQ